MKTGHMLLVITTILTVLAGGVFFAWSCSVTPGLKLLPDQEYFSTFRSLNRAIQNPVFFACFFGAALLLPVCAWKYYSSPPSPVFRMLSGATATYLIGVMAVTFFGNIPINQTIETININMPSAGLHEKRVMVETSWNRLNMIRTVASVISIALVICACLKIRPE
jgi:uncharacterized membrane protein